MRTIVRQQKHLGRFEPPRAGLVTDVTRLRSRFLGAIVLGIGLFAAIGAAWSDLVYFKAGNRLAGFVEMQEQRLVMALELGGVTVLDPEQVSTISYEFDLMDGNALPDYLRLAKELDNEPDFAQLTPRLQGLSRPNPEALPEASEQVRAEIDRFAARHADLFQKLVEISKQTRCERADDILRKAADVSSPEAASFSEEILPKIEGLYLAYLLADEASLPDALRAGRAFTGLRLANHWQKSMPEEAAASITALALPALDELQTQEVSTAAEAWNRIQDMLRFQAIYEPVNPAEATQLDFKVREAAYRSLGLSLPERLNPADSKDWVRLLAAEVAAAFPAREESPALLDEVRTEAFAARLIERLDPQWSPAKSADYRTLERLNTEVEKRLNRLLSADAGILRRAGYRKDVSGFNPLKSIPEGKPGE